MVMNRRFFPRDLDLVRRVVSERGREGAEAVAGEVCRLLAWHGGKSRCQEVLLALAGRDLVELPWWEQPQQRRHRRPEPGPPPQSLDTSPIESTISSLPGIRLSIVGQDEDGLWSSLLHRYHPLGVRVVIGEHLKYFAWLEQRPVALLLWGRASLKLAARDRRLAWSPQERRDSLHRVANNYRFLILPWVRVPNLGSHVLSINVRRIDLDWKQAFGRNLDLLETFVDPERFQATSYRAANWIPVGLTHGSGRTGPNYHFHGHQKMILLYPLSREMRDRLRDRDPPIPSVPASLLTPGASTSSDTGILDGGSMTIPTLNAPPCTEEPACVLEAADLKLVAKELQSFHRMFRDVFPRREPWEKAEIYLRGLLSSEVERHNAERMALYGPTALPPRTMQFFLTESCWPDDAVRIRNEQLVADLLGEPDGLLILDGSDFPKKGSESAGVARQYCGALGKTDNCQAGLFLCYASSRGATLFDADLFLPESWFTEKQKAERWPACRIPEDRTFKTKPDIGAAMINAVFERGQLPIRWVLADEFFGRDSAFRASIPSAYSYFIQVPCNTRVWVDRPKVEEVEFKRKGKLYKRLRIVKGQPRPRELRELADDSNLVWEQVTLKEGAKGPIEAEVTRVRGVDVQNKLPGTDVWAFFRRNPVTKELQYYLSSASAQTPMEVLVRVCPLRWTIEICFRETKNELGMDHYEVRSWTGWHHHMTLVMLAHHFLLRARLRLKKILQA